MTEEMKELMEKAVAAAELAEFSKTLTKRELYLVNKLAQLLLFKVVLDFGAAKGKPEEDYNAAVVCVLYDLFDVNKVEDLSTINPFERTTKTMAALAQALDDMNGNGHNTLDKLGRML